MKSVLLHLFLIVLFLGVACLSTMGQATPSGDTTPIAFTRRPKPMYTDIARRKNVQGTVVLRVQFLANGQIGEIVDATRKNREKLTKYGLVEKAMEAARKIEFVPARKDGQPVAVVKTLEYSFSIY